MTSLPSLTQAPNPSPALTLASPPPSPPQVMSTSPGSQQGLKEFSAELRILSRLHHPHILLLLGACPERGILVYELMEGGSLEEQVGGWGRSRLLAGAVGLVAVVLACCCGAGMSWMVLAV